MPDISNDNPIRVAVVEDDNTARAVLEILSLLAKGLLYKEIAGKLFIEVETVKTHIRHIYEKLQVHTRSEAILKYLGR